MNDMYIYEAARILAGMDENYMTESSYGSKMKEAFIILEDNDSPITRDLHSKLIQSVMNKAHIDFGDIPNSKGNIRNYTGYSNMIETLNVIKDLASKSDVKAAKDVISYADVVLTAIDNIANLSAIYERGFNEKIAYVALEYNAYVYNCVEATTALLYTYIDYLQTPNEKSERIVIKNTKLRADEFYFNQLKSYNTVISKNGTNYRKMLEQMCNGDRNNFTGLSVDALVGIGAISMVALSIVPITRKAIYQLYHLRSKLSDQLSAQATFLELNQTCLENNSTMDPKRKKKVMEKQKNLAKHLKNLSDSIRVKSSKSINDANRELSKNNNSLDLDSIKNDINNSPLELL